MNLQQRSAPNIVYGWQDRATRNPNYFGRERDPQPQTRIKYPPNPNAAPRNTTRKGMPIARKDEWPAQLSNDLASDEIRESPPDYRDDDWFQRVVNVMKAFFLSRWEDGDVIITLGTLGRTFGYPSYLDAALETLRLDEVLYLQVVSLRTWIIPGVEPRNKVLEDARWHDWEHPAKRELERYQRAQGDSIDDDTESN